MNGCRGPRLLRCIRAYDEPAIRIDRCQCPSSATWWWVSPPVDRKPEAGQGEHHDAEGIGGCRTVCERIGEQRQQLPVLEEQAGPAGRAGHPDHGRARLIVITLAVLAVLQAGCHSPRLGRLGVMELRRLRYRACERVGSCAYQPRSDHPFERGVDRLNRRRSYSKQAGLRAFRLAKSSAIRS